MIPDFQGLNKWIRRCGAQLLQNQYSKSEHLVLLGPRRVVLGLITESEFSLLPKTENPVGMNGMKPNEAARQGKERKTMTPRDFLSETASRPSGQQRIVVDGKPWAKSLWKIGMLVPCVFLAVWLWRLESPWFAGTDADFQLKFVALIVFLFALCLPGNAHTYLDLTLRQVVTLKHYAGFKIGERYRPFDEYDSIVVRHRSHSGEGGVSYTGSVGLRPANKDPVLWVKSFPAHSEEIPQAAYDFARELHDKTGLDLDFF